MSIIDLIDQLPKHPTKQYPSRSLETIRRIVVHHTAGPANQTPQQIADFHVRVRGWPGIAYHYLVGADGQVFKVNKATTISYCVAHGNSASLCVCLLGDFSAAPPPKAQWDAAVQLVKTLKITYDIEDVYGHRETPTSPPQATACPGAMFDCDAFRDAVNPV